ncbi:MAG: sulfite exporter TauE/SafE family protein [Candidatus Heimdallarchaeota archaeon]|nr:sulfite exporter TauE/SafE family protein [Candidatus Heimdallarchaeota archaeon]
MDLLMEFSWILILVGFLALICEFMDSSLGMGYGTTLTPILLFMGFEAYQIVPAVLVSEFFTGLISAGFHALFKNMSLGRTKTITKDLPLTQSRVSTDPNVELIASTSSGISVTEKQTFMDKLKSFTIDSKIVFVLTIFGIIGTIASAIISVVFGFNSVFKFGVKIYIGVMVFFMGVLILAFRKKNMKFSFKRVTAIGALAGFNKGISGGGYGPLTVSGQILSGREGKNAIASTSLSEGIICFVGVLTYIITNLITSHSSGRPLDIGSFGLAPYLIIGGILSTPFAALTTKSIENRWLKLSVGAMTVIMGLFSLLYSILTYVGVW